MNENARQNKPDKKNNNNKVQNAANVVSKMGGTTGAVVKGAQIANRAINKKTSENNSRTLNGYNRAGKIAPQKTNAASSNKNSDKESSSFSSSTQNVVNNNSNGNPSFDDNIKGSIKTPKITKNYATVIVIITVFVFLLIYITIIAAIGGNDDSFDGNGGVTINSINGIGNYFINGEDSNYFNNSLVYIDENNISTTYDINDFITGVIYNLTEDSLSREIYKVYAILLRTNIISDSDGVIEAKDYQYVNPIHARSYMAIKNSVDETKYELLLDSGNNIVKTDFSNNSCDNCTKEDGISLNLVKTLVNNGYNYKQVIEEIFDNCYVTQINFSTTGSISLELKDTTKSTYLNRPITEFLNSHGSSLDDLNNYISNSVAPVYGTGEGVATAAVALINYLYDGFGIKLPYYWGGKYEHVGANPSFGVYRPTPRSNGQIYKYVSLDCSGLAQWAIINGGIKNPGTGTVYFAQAFTNRCNITSSNCVGEVGDLINYRTFDNRRGHVQVIVSVDRANNSYYIAESSTNGVVVTTRPMHKGRDDATVYVLHMANYYANNVRR